MTEIVECAIEAGVATVALNRPERRNALSPALIEALHSQLQELDGDASVRAIVITGRGKAFCAGGDLAGGLAGDGVLSGHHSRGAYGRLLALLPRLGAPVVAAVNGHALGGGLGLAAACDLIVADPEAKLGTPEIKVGLFPMVITAVLQRNVPRKVLLQWMLLGERVTAEHAARVHLVNKVSAPGEALAEAREWAQRLASLSPAVLSLGKQAFYGAADEPYDHALDYLNHLLTLNLLTEDAMEGVAAFLQKRTPEWKGR